MVMSYGDVIQDGHRDKIDDGDDESPIPHTHHEVNMEQRGNAREGETGDLRENPPISDIVLLDTHMRKPGASPPGIKPGSPRTRRN
ncbi:hypothetical protein PR048_022425 [Dryococelus australis]|uniref:Uncharacterized protein n=1 Tax=Dryococelus australis TaxID=614101 RepID=A0ABQ9H120_9NEOP|nr:hypothetical protein PR048_022425 [Dryococelus australis]